MKIVVIGGVGTQGRTTVRDLSESSEVEEILVADLQEAKALSAGLGRDISADELIEAALRVRHLERAYEAREGLTREDDTLPGSVFKSPISRGAYKGMKLERDKFEKMKDEYYTIRGWDVKTGIPTEETLNKFGLNDVAQDLKKRGILPTAAKEA